MSLSARITETPVPFDPDKGEEAAALAGDNGPGARALIAGAAGCSPYLAGLIAAEGEGLGALLEAEPEAAFDTLLEELAALPDAGLKAGLRHCKRRGALLIALADLGGVWPVEEVTGRLTDFADHCLSRALGAMIGAEIARGRLPADADAVKGAGMVALAMGKMGARELNYSSDIDLICLFDDSRFGPDDFAEARAAFIRATKRMCALLSEQTGEGYVFRTDLRLRPDAQVTPVCLGMEAAERYYESLGRTWERAAYIKARPAAGDVAAGEAFLGSLAPFVWRRHLDFAALRDAEDMLAAIRSHKGVGERAGTPVLEGRDLKLAPGGIREIEFFVQTRQLIAGGRDPSLRVRGTLEALARLADAGWIPGETRDALSAAYRAHRRLEHRLQMIQDAQTHSLPADADGMARLAAFCGEGDPGAFREELASRLREVSSLVEGFFAARPATAAGIPEGLPADAAATAEGWRRYPALRSARAREIFDRLSPEILARLARAGRPAEALAAFDRFLGGLPAGVQLFALFEANPQLIDLLVDIVATAPALGRHLSRNPGVLDGVIGGDFFAPWPGEAALGKILEAALPGDGDYERALDSARRWAKEWHFRIGVHLLRGLITPEEAGAQYSDLAGAVLAGLWPRVQAEFARKHGPAPGAGAVVMAMGAFGARQMQPLSDLDLIVLYEAGGGEMSEGKRPLSARAYYARLTQALVTALSAPMAEGRLYEVDMRLRPSGRQGPVATAIAAFERYQREDAWVWEHMALTRARPVAGSTALAGRVEEIRRSVIAAAGPSARIREGLADMRERLAREKPPEGPLDTKRGPGRAQDVELLAAAAALLSGSAERAAAEQLADGARAGWLTEDEGRVLRDAHGLFRRVVMAAGLVEAGPVRPEALAEGAREALLRATGAESLDALTVRLGDAEKRSRAAIGAVLARLGGEAGGDG